MQEVNDAIQVLQTNGYYIINMWCAEDLQNIFGDNMTIEEYDQWLNENSNSIGNDIMEYGIELLSNSIPQ